MQSILNYFNKPILKISLAFGVVTGLLCFFYFLGLYFLHITPLGNKKVLDYGIHVIMMSACCWNFRRYAGNGYLHLWEGITICYIVNSVAALFTGWLIYGFVTQIDTTVFPQYLAEMKQLLVSTKGQLIEKLGPKEYDIMIADVQKIKPSDLISDEFVKKSIIGVLPILIISMAFRKQDYGIYNTGK